MEEFKLENIKLIVGLGNEGNEFINTRHNIGFNFVEKLAGSSKFLKDTKLKASLFSKDINGKKYLLIKPQTQMNLSGEAVNLVSKYYEIEPAQILIVHDDLDLKIGCFKIMFSKGPKLHNGINSIENRLGTSDFWRLRIGVDNRDLTTRENIPPSSYVLSRFRVDENEILNRCIELIIKEWII